MNDPSAHAHDVALFQDSPSRSNVSRVRPAFILMIACIAVIGTIVLVPSSALIFESFSTRTAAGDVLSLDNYVKVLSQERTFDLLLATVGFSLAMTFVAGSLGFVFAWIAARTNTPFRRFMPIAVLLPYLVPPTLGAVMWILLLSPSNGIINTLLAPIVGGPLFNIYSFAGMVFVESLYTFPLSFMFFYASLSTLDPTLEEAAAVSGAGTLRTFLHTTLPSMWPTIISVATLLFIIGFESFDVAWFLGYPAKIYILSIEVFLLTRFNYPPDIGAAAVYGVIALVLAMFLVVLYRQVTSRRGRFVSITGKGYHTGVLDIGRWRYATCGFFYGLIAVIGVLPVTLLIAISLNAVSWPFAVTPDVSLTNFLWIFNDPEARRALWNTATLAFFGALLVVTVSFFVSYLSVRTEERGRGFLDYVAFLPFAFPSTVLAVGIISVLIQTPLYNTIWIMLLAFFIKFLPYGLRNLSNNMLQIHHELEEASYVSGAGLMRTLWKVILPLTIPGIVAAWSLLFIVFMRQFSLPIMLSSPGSQVLTILLFQEWDAGQMGHVAALGTVLMLCCIPFVVIARYLARGAQSI
ncbi:MAG TPA: iron ABC transporter permease [Azospirillum sp.]|nr:iron ABC transporter permease [Azospirillum sp.]